jgi:hypothetical protein
MLKAALLQNIQTRPDVFGSRHHAPLPGVRMPLPTLPAIVGSHNYMPGPIDRMMRTPEQLDDWYRKRYGSAYIPPGKENPATQFYRRHLAATRRMIDSPVSGVSEPTLNNPQR